MTNDLWRDALKFGQKGLWEEIAENLSYCRQARWRKACEESGDALNHFGTQQTIYTCTVLGKTGVVLQPQFDAGSSSSENYSELIYPVQIKLSGWIRENGGRLNHYQQQADHFYLHHGFGRLSRYLIEGRSMELPIALYLLGRELNLSLKEIWGGSGRLEEKGGQLLVKSVELTDVKAFSFFREFPQGRVLLPKSPESEKLQIQHPSQIFPVQTFSEAANLVFGKEILVLKIPQLDAEDPLMLWKDLCYNYEIHHTHPEAAITRWEVVEKTRPTPLHPAANAYRTAAFVLYATHLGKNLNRVANDVESTLMFFHDKQDLRDRIAGLWQIGTKLDAELDYAFIKKQVEQPVVSATRTMEDYRRLGWWAVLTGKIQEDPSLREFFLKKAAFYLNLALKEKKEPGRQAQTYNHYAELCLLRGQPEEAQHYLEVSRGLFDELYDKYLQRQNRPYWLQLQLRIDNALGNHMKVLHFPLQSKYQPFYMRGFLETEKIRAAIRIKNVTKSDLETMAFSAQKTVRGDAAQPILNLLSLIPWMELFLFLPEYRQKEILQEALKTLNEFKKTGKMINLWKVAVKSTLEDGDFSGQTMSDLTDKFLQLMPYNY